MENIIIINPDKLEKIKNNFKKDGPTAVHILSDFDRTLTYHSQGGRKNPVLIAILRDGNYLASDYGSRERALYEKYYPLEINPDIPLAEKKTEMAKWYRQVFALMISFGLTKEIVERAVKDCSIKLRDGVDDWLDFISRLRIPLVIFSSSGLGGEAINIFLKRLKKPLPDIHILANALVWDKDGKALGVSEPIMHPFNKDETLIHNFPFFPEIKNRRNVILLGDSWGDAGMAEGFEHDNLLKIGFLNEKAEKNLDSFKQVYDVIILGDPSFEFINQLFKEIFPRFDTIFG